MTDFSIPRRMSAGAFIIILLKSIKEYVGITLIPLAYLLFKSDYQESSVDKILGIILGLSAIALITAFFRYYFKKFHIEDDKLIFTSGIAAKQTASIPLSRVHTLRTRQGLFYRLFELRGISFDTLATDKQEVELILDEKDWQTLLNRVNNGENISHSKQTTVPPPLPSEDINWEISNSSILKGALCQNHLKGFAILFAFLLAIIDKLDSFDDDASTRMIDYISTHAGDTMPSVGQWLCFIAVIYLIVMVLWVGKTIIRYGDMVIRITGKKLTAESGLITRFTCRFARDKVSTISVKQNPLEKITGCQTITLSQATNVADNETKGNIRIYGSNLSREMLVWWLDDDNYNLQKSLISSKSGIGLFYRKFIPHLIIALAAGIVIFLEWSPLIALTICPVYIAVAVWRAISAWKHSSIELKDSYIKINCGNIACIQRYIKYGDIESVEIKTTPFTRFSQRVSLRISTNSSIVTVLSLKLQNANELANRIMNTP